MTFRLHIAALVLAGFAIQGCATGLLVRPPADEAHLPIPQAIADLGKVGYECKAVEDAAFCTHPEWFDVVVDSKGDPPRLIHAAAFSLKPGFTCDSLAEKLTAMNRDYNLATVYCLSDKDSGDRIVAQSAILLSSRGHSPADLKTYFGAWSEGLKTMMKQGEVLDALK